MADARDALQQLTQQVQRQLAQQEQAAATEERQHIEAARQPLAGAAATHAGPRSPLLSASVLAHRCSSAAGGSAGGGGCAGREPPPDASWSPQRLLSECGRLRQELGVERRAREVGGGAGGAAPQRPTATFMIEWLLQCAVQLRVLAPVAAARRCVAQGFWIAQPAAPSMYTYTAGAGGHAAAARAPIQTGDRRPRGRGPRARHRLGRRVRGARRARGGKQAAGRRGDGAAD